MNWTAQRLEMILDLAFCTSDAAFLLQFTIATTVDISRCFTFFFFSSFSWGNRKFLAYFSQCFDPYRCLQRLKSTFEVHGIYQTYSMGFCLTVDTTDKSHHTLQLFTDLQLQGLPSSLSVWDSYWSKNSPQISREGHNYCLQPFPQNSTGDTVYIWKKERLKTCFQLASVSSLPHLKNPSM